MTDLQLPPIAPILDGEERGPANGVDELGRPFDFDDIFPEARGPHELDPPESVLDVPPTLWPIELPMQTKVLERSDREDDPKPLRHLVTLLRDESKHVKNDGLRRVLLGESGRMLVQLFDEAQAGDVALREANCAGTKAAFALTRAIEEDLHKRLADLASEANNRTLGAAERAAAWIEHGLLCEQRLADIKRAFESYKSALAYAPTHPIANELATGAALLMGRKTDARKLLEQAIRRRAPANLTAALLVDLAEITDDAKQRRAHLQRAHDLAPTQETALRRLIREVRIAEEPKTLALLYRKLATLAKDPISVSNALLAGLTALSDLTGDAQKQVSELTDQFIVELATWISRHPDEASARGPLSELVGYLERQGSENLTKERQDMYLGALEQLAPLLEDRREQALLREQLARLLWRRIHPEIRTDKLDFSTPRGPLSPEELETYDALIDNLRRSREYLPERRWLWETLAAALFERGETTGLIQHLEHWATAQPPGAARAEVLLYLGQANERVLADYPRAAEIYELAVAEEPRNPDGLRALGKVYGRMGRWSDAVGTLQRQVTETTDSSERLTLLRQLATMAEHKLADLDLAIATLREVADLDGSDIRSLYQLADLCQAHDRPRILVYTLKMLVDRLDDDVARTAVLARLGETQLAAGQTPDAIKSLETALTLSPGYTPALQLLTKLYRQNSDFESLLALQTPKVDPVSDPALLALKSGRVCFEEIGDIDRGIEYLTQSYELNPDLLPAREILLQLLQANGKIGDAYDLLRAQDAPETPALQADNHYRLGLLAEALSRQEDKDKNLNRALQHYRATLELQPKHGLAFERARMLLVRYHDVDNLVRLLENGLQHLEGASRLPLLVQLGRLHMTRLPEQFEQARRAYERALEVAPRDGILRREYENLLRQVDDQKNLPAQRLALAGISEDTHYKATLLVESAESLLTSGANREDREFAANAILGALREDPGNPYAVRQLEGLLSDPNSPLTMTDAVGARAVRAQSDAERAIFYLESAELLEWSGAHNEAQRAYKAALRAIPGLAPAEDGLRRLATGRRRETSGAKSKTKAVSVHTLMAEAREAAVVAGNSGNAADAEHALTLLGQILGRDPHYRDAIGLTRALVKQLSDPKPALNLLSTVFGRITETSLRYELGVFLGEQTEDHAAAVAYFQVACEARPDGRSALRGVVRCYQRMGDEQKLADAMERLVELYDPSEPSAVDLRLSLADQLSQKPETLARALEHTRVVLEARGDDPRALQLMIGLYERMQKPVEAAATLERLILRERAPERLHQYHMRRARLLGDLPEYQEQALEAVERAAQLRPSDRNTVLLLTRMLDRAGQTGRVASYLDPIRAALFQSFAQQNVLNDLRLLADISRNSRPELSKLAERLTYDIQPESGTPPPLPSSGPATVAGLQRVLGTASLRDQLLSPAEPADVSDLIGIVEATMDRLHPQFGGLRASDLVQLPTSVDPTELGPKLGEWGTLLGLHDFTLAACNTNNTVAIMEDSHGATLRLGINLWYRGDGRAWRGLAAVGLARRALGGSLVRALNADELDLTIAACFEVAKVFNPITADPDSQRLQDLSGLLVKQLSRRQRRALGRVCQGLASTNFEQGGTARATLVTDLQMAVLLSGDIGGCLSAACLLDGFANGPVVERLALSRSAQALLLFLVSDHYFELREVVATTK